MVEPDEVEFAYNSLIDIDKPQSAHLRPVGTMYALCGIRCLAGTRNSIERKKAASLNLCGNCRRLRALAE